MKLAIVQNNIIERVGELVDLFPNVSFSSNGVDDAFMTENSLYYVVEWEYIDDSIYKIEHVEPYISYGKVYTYTVQEKTDDERQEYHDQIKKKLELNIRYKRNQLLKDTDWTQVDDAPVNKQAYADYRQALRDITLQEGFPFNIEWPVAP